MSSPTSTINQTAHERWLAFTHSLGQDDYVEDGIIRAVKIMASICRVMFGDENADAGFTAMIGRILPDRPEEGNWEQMLEEEPAAMFFETPLGQLIHDLIAYADFGIVLTPTRDIQQRELLLETKLRQAEDLLHLLPVEQWELATEYMFKIIRKASARWKLDTGARLNAEELAVLSGRALQTIRNYVAGSPSIIRGNQNGIDAKEAEKWLSRQKDFHMSIWRQQDDTDNIATADLGLGKVLFLPVAKDGSVFHPGLRRNGKYVIDAEGRERDFEEFDDALKELQSMYFPEWRRPTSGGVWTRVRAVEWRRYGEDDVALMVQASQRDHPSQGDPRP